MIAYDKKIEDVLNELNTDTSRGLSDSEVQERLLNICREKGCI